MASLFEDLRAFACPALKATHFPEAVCNQTCRPVELRQPLIWVPHDMPLFVDLKERDTLGT